MKFFKWVISFEITYNDHDIWMHLISPLNDYLHINVEIFYLPSLLYMIKFHFLFVREIVENEMTHVSIDNFKEIKQLKILWVL